MSRGRLTAPPFHAFELDSFVAPTSRPSTLTLSSFTVVKSGARSCLAAPLGRAPALGVELSSVHDIPSLPPRRRVAGRSRPGDRGVQARYRSYPPAREPPKISGGATRRAGRAAASGRRGAPRRTQGIPAQLTDFARLLGALHE